jgi:hypothetical protein
MSPEALGGGAFTWSRIQRLYDTDPAVHWQRCESEGLECPLEVFAQLFHLSRLSCQVPLGQLNLSARSGRSSRRDIARGCESQSVSRQRLTHRCHNAQADQYDC